MNNQALAAIVAACFVMLTLHLTGCGKPPQKSELELKFDQIEIGQTMDAVVDLMGEPDSKTTDSAESADYTSADGTMTATKGARVHTWAYDEEPNTMIVIFCGNNDIRDPKDVVYSRMSLSTGPSVRIK